MKAFLVLLALSSITALAGENECRTKVLSYHKGVYHKTYGAASNTFLNNFVGRKNILAHTFAYPDIAFVMTGPLENYIAGNMVEHVKCKNISARDIVEKYYEVLDSGELCKDLGDDYKKPRKIRSYLYSKLGVE